MKFRHLSQAIVGFALVLAAPVVSAETVSGAGTIQVAQTQSGDQPAHAPASPDMKKAHDEHGGKDGHAWNRHQMCQTTDARQAEFLAASEAKLKLTDDQKPAWNKFAEALTTAHKAMIKQICPGAQDKALPATLPERLAKAEQRTQAKLAGIQALRIAVEDLYKSLTPAQQKIADMLPLAGRGHHHHHMPHD